MSIEHITLRQGHVLHKMSVPLPPAKVKKVVKKVADDGSVYVILEVDSSGSMYPYDRERKVVAEKQIRASQAGDRWAIGDFSSRGDFEWYAQLASADTDKDKEMLVGLVNRMSIRAMTCFAEILEDTAKVIKKSDALGLPRTLVFVTDGYPTDGLPTHRILDALKVIAPSLDSALFVGCGPYYNKALLATMAEAAGGQVCHSANMDEFGIHLKSVIETTREAAVKTTVSIPEGFAREELGGLFTVRAKSVTLLAADNDRRVELAVPSRGEGVLFGISDKPVAGSIEAKYDRNDAGDMFLKGLYAAALVQTQKLKTDLAVETLGVVGDPALVTDAANAFTPDDFGRAEARILRAVERSDGRFKKGYKPNCVPDRNAFTAIHVLEALGKDELGRFHPYHPGFKYRKIGRPSIPKPGNPEFVPLPNPSVELDEFVPHKELLNLSCRIRIPGTVKLDAEAAKYGLQENFPTFIWRNYAMIESGNANCPMVPFSMSQSTFEEFKKQGVVSGEWEKGQPTLVDFTDIPVMNRAMADGIDSAIPVCDLKGRELELQGAQKVLKYYLDEATAGEGVKEKSPLSPEAVAYLERFFITSNGFSPPVDKAEPTDEYEAKAFYVDIAGFSSLPSVNEVLKRMDFLKAGKDDKGKAAKPLTRSQELLSKKIEEVRTTLAKYNGNAKDAKYQRWLDTQIKDNKQELREIRAQLQRIKMAVILSGRWFKEFTSREGCALDHKGLTYKFTLETVKIAI